MTEQLHFHFSLSCIGEGSGNPLQCSCLENPRDGGAWWAAVSGVTQSRTWLKWLSSSNSAALLCNSLFLLINCYRVKGLATKIILKLFFLKFNLKRLFAKSGLSPFLFFPFVTRLFLNFSLFCWKIVRFLFIFFKYLSNVTYTFIMKVKEVKCHDIWFH